MASDEDAILEAVANQEWGRLSKLLYAIWSRNALDCFSVMTLEPWERVDDERKINDLMFYPLALALTADKRCKDADGIVSLTQLAETTGFKPTNALISRGQICGRMFRYGELTYSCKECANDPTCVLCYDCFKNSDHVNHKYKMHSTEGNGYCDCGDPEAFLNSPVCKLHMASDEDKDNFDKQLPKDLHLRIHSVVLAALKFVVDVLGSSMDQEPSVPSVMNYQEVAGDTFQTILFNDETHTYESVIRALTTSIFCHEHQAKKLAATVDREGRTVVCMGSEEKCRSIKEQVQRRTQKDTSRRTQKSGPLLVKVMRSSVVACQSFAVYLVHWLTAQVKHFAPLGPIIGNVLLHECSFDCRNGMFAGQQNTPIPTVDFDTSAIQPSCGHKSPCVRLVLMDRKMWKSARVAIHQMFMTGVLMDFKHKQNFGSLLINHFDEIYNDYVDDDHEHKFSVVAIAVQVFTIPTIGRYLVKEENAIEVITTYMHQFLQKYVKMAGSRLPVLDFSSNSSPTVMERALFSMIDLSYLLNTPPKPAEWDARLRTSFLRGAADFLRLIRDFQNMDEVKRQYSEHQMTDTEWETAFMAWAKMLDPLPLMIKWSNGDALVHLNVLAKCVLEILRQVEHMEEFQNRRRLVKVNEHEAMSLEFDVSREPVSIWQPIWRYCAALFTAAPHIMANYVCEDELTKEDSDIPKITDYVSDVRWQPHENVKKVSLKGLRTLLLEMPLRCVVLRSQFNAQLWRRNGFSFANQIHTYQYQSYRTEMFDRDILMMQAMAAVTDPNRFLIRLLDRFSLIRFATFGFEDLPLSRSVETTPSTPSASHEDLSKITVNLAEEMLQILIYIVMERYQEGVGQISAEQALCREALHVLCMGPCPFSHIDRYIASNQPYRRVSLDEVVKVVGDFKRPGQSTGVFVLKPELRDQYNAFFWHYSRINISQAEQMQKKDRSNADRAVRACPPPICPEFEPFFKPVIRLLECRVFCQLLRVTFDRYAKQSRFSGEGLLHRALFLCGAALNEQLLNEKQRKQAILEQKTPGRRLQFIENAELEKLAESLKNCTTRAEKDGYSDLLWWTRNRYEEVLKAHKGEDEQEQKTQEKSCEEDDMEDKAAKRSKIAQAKREQALQRMKKLQSNFRSQHKAFFEEGVPKKALKRETTTDVQPSSSSTDPVQPTEDEPMDLDTSQSMDIEDEAETGFVHIDCSDFFLNYSVLPPDSGFPICLGANSVKAQQKAQRRVTCILCQEDEVLSFDHGIVCAAYVESNRLFARTPVRDKARRTDNIRYCAPSDLYFGQNVSTCAHTMHYHCYRTLIQVAKANERQRARNQAISPRTVNVDDNEYHCPLCKRLCNAAMPLLPTLKMLKGVVPFSANRKNADEEFADWVQRMQELCSQQIYSASSGDNPVKAHSRKRSHSERSLAEFKKDQAKEAGTTQFCVPFPLSRMNSSLSASSENASALFSLSAASSTTDLLGGSPLRSSDTITNFLHETLEAIRGLLNKVESRRSQPHTYSAWDTLAQFSQSLRQPHTKLPVGQPPRPGSEPDGIEDILSIYTTTGYVLRSISAILRLEQKPLFGALNTRQMDSINGMVRLCAVVAFTAKPIALRLMMSRLLSPFVLPLSANRPVPDQLYTAKTLNNVGEIRRHLNNLLRNPQPARLVSRHANPAASLPAQAEPLAVPGSSPHQLDAEVPSNSSTAPASPGPSTSRSPDPHSAQNPFVDLNLLNVDMVSMAIELAMLSGWSVIQGGKQFLHNIGKVEEGPPRVPDGSVDEHHAVQLCLLAHLFQAIVCFTNPEEPPKTTSSSSISEEVERIRINDSESSLEPMLSDGQLEERLGRLVEVVRPDMSTTTDVAKLRENLKECALEFLRPLAVFYSALTLVPPPEALKHSSFDEFEPLCRYMGMPVGLSALLEGEFVERLFKQWSSYVHLPDSLVASRRPVHPRTLVQLPHDYTDLVNRAAKFRCPSVKADGMTGSVVTMCLVCGELLCSQSYCCQGSFRGKNIGSCTHHMYFCSGSTGLFLRVRECQVMFLTAARRGCLKAAPYVDQFGETDWGFKRGHPLFLSTEQFRKLQRLWLHQEVSEEVVNQYEINIRNSALDWNHF